MALKADNRNYVVNRTKTELIVVKFNQEQLLHSVTKAAKELANFQHNQTFEKTDVVFGKHGGVLVTFTNPTANEGVPVDKIPK